jgi:hypothetical protein
MAETDINVLLGTLERTVDARANESKAIGDHYAYMQRYKHEGGLDVGAVEIASAFNQFADALRFSALAAASGIIGNTIYDLAKSATVSFVRRKKDREGSSLTEVEARRLFSYGIALHNATRPGDQLIIEELHPDEESFPNRFTRFTPDRFYLSEGYWIGQYSGTMTGRATRYVRDDSLTWGIVRAIGLPSKAVPVHIVWDVPQTLEIRIPSGNPKVDNIQFRRTRANETCYHLEWSGRQHSQAVPAPLRDQGDAEARELMRPVLEDAPVQAPDHWRLIDRPSPQVVQDYLDMVKRFDGDSLAAGKFRSYTPPPPPPGGVCGL